MNSQSNKDYAAFSDKWNKIIDSGEHVGSVLIMTHVNNDYFVTDSVTNGDSRKTILSRGSQTEHRYLPENMILEF